ncbi:MAG: hypothetical protein HY964_07945 [Ignavibacteriales bacterium]|nr:hypothetical protein [Ignavibacteriales bacterium]
MKKKSTKKIKSDKLKKLFNKHLEALDKIERAARFPIENPSIIILENSDWQIQKHESKNYPGAASFFLSAHI